ncbi:hypothetical protein [Sphingomonas paucimobilis]|uniref:Mor transcription activator domain-containing protein n=1 Tax=Sphingomonas paucimobilis TaxID=13689 RepID=A0A7T3ABM9_SPHPI|nr:hypothetical protein [Sphingomonas paucimobilis]QPT09695.1 hypothetical protein I6G38_05415 [Sphingomonas paucimobilis]
MRTRHAPDLVELIGEAAFVRLAEAFGGTRLYIPSKLDPDHEIVEAVGKDAAILLVERLAPDVIKVPLAREIRARHYRARNWSNARIARALQITESGVEKLFRRVPDDAKSSPQLDMFR